VSGLLKMRKILKSLIPGQYFSRIIHLKNSLFERPRKSYSQFGEDIILAKLLKKKTGFYVDVGAYHPKHYSNTYLLYKKGWRGINIDPNPDMISLFRRARGRDVNVQVGVSKIPSSLTYYRFSHSNWNTFSKEQSDMWQRKPSVRFLGEQQIQCIPLREVLQEHLPQGAEIDLLNVDAEKMDLDVLESNDWEKYHPEVVVVESPEFNPDIPSKNEIYSFLRKKSYRLYAFMGVSLIFLKKNNQNEP